MAHTDTVTITCPEHTTEHMSLSEARERLTEMHAQQLADDHFVCKYDHEITRDGVTLETHPYAAPVPSAPVATDTRPVSSVETRAISALWYAWGQIDSGLFPTLTLDDGFTFQREQETVASEYYSPTHARFMMPSLLQAWEDFTARTIAGRA